jgi:hypothetical protein
MDRFQLAELHGAGLRRGRAQGRPVQLHQQFVGSQVRILLPVRLASSSEPWADAPKVAEIVCRTMREAFLEILGDDFPVVVEHKISQRWGETAATL